MTEPADERTAKGFSSAATIEDADPPPRWRLRDMLVLVAWSAAWFGLLRLASPAGRRLGAIAMAWNFVWLLYVRFGFGRARRVLMRTLVGALAAVALVSLVAPRPEPVWTNGTGMGLVLSLVASFIVAFDAASPAEPEARS